MEAGPSSIPMSASISQGGESQPMSLNKQLACAACRLAKVKCKPLQDSLPRSAGDPCARCVKHSLGCEYRPRKKRRKMKPDEQDTANDSHTSFATPSPSAQAQAHTSLPPNPHAHPRPKAQATLPGLADFFHSQSQSQAQSHNNGRASTSLEAQNQHLHSHSHSHSHGHGQGHLPLDQMSYASSGSYQNPTSATNHWQAPAPTLNHNHNHNHNHNQTPQLHFKSYLPDPSLPHQHHSQHPHQPQPQSQSHHPPFSWEPTNHPSASPSDTHSASAQSHQNVTQNQNQHQNQTNHSRPRAAMSFRQELQQIKDDMGIPPTRDVSRNVSPELDLPESVNMNAHQHQAQGQGGGGGGGSGYLDGGQSWFNGSTPLPVIGLPSTGPDLPGLLSADEVADLFAKFFTHHNTSIGLLDPTLHTPSFVHTTSTLLFHTILAVTAGSFRTSIYAELWRRTKGMINMAFAAAEETVELCQAVSLATLWNDIEDSSGSLRLGFAVRIGYQLGLNQPLRRPLPQNELQARLQLNKERTWFHLTLCELTLNVLYGGLPPMVQLESLQAIEAWSTEHPQYPCVADSILAIGAEGAPIINAFVVPEGVELGQQELGEIMINVRRMRLDWTMRWMGPNALTGPSRHHVKAYLNALEKGFARDSCSMARIHAQGFEDREEWLWNDIYACIDSLRGLTDSLNTESILFWGINSCALHASKCALLLTKHITMLSPATAKGVLAMFQEIYKQSSVGASVGTRKHYLAKLFGNLLRISATRLAEKAGSSSSDGGWDNRNIVPAAVPDVITANEQLPWWSENDTSWLNVPTNEGYEYQPQLEGLIDNYLLQFANGAG